MYPVLPRQRPQDRSRRQSPTDVLEPDRIPRRPRDDSGRFCEWPASRRRGRHADAALRARTPSTRERSDTSPEAPERRGSDRRKQSSGARAPAGSWRRAPSRGIDRMVRATRRPVRAQLAQRRSQVDDQHREWPFQRRRSADKDIVMARRGVCRQHQPRHFSKPATGAVARHRVADFPARRDTEPNCRRSGVACDPDLLAAQPVRQARA